MADQNPSHIDPVKNSFDLVQRKAPESVWAGLDHKLSLDHTEQVVADAFGTVNKKAPESGWSGVKKQLIIDDVWLNISAALNKRKRRFFWLYFSGFAIFLISAVSSWKFYSGDESVTEKITTKSNAVQTNFPVSVDQSIKQLIPVIANDSEMESDASREDHLTDVIEKKQVDPDYQEALVSPDSLIDIKSGTGMTDINLGYTVTKQNPAEKEFIVKFPPPLICPIESGYLFSESPGDIEPFTPPVFNRFELGIVAGVDNSWIFNNDVKDGLNRFSLVDNKFSIGYHAGVNAYVNFSENHGLGLHANFLSVMNQRYDFFAGGNILTNHVVLRQQKYNLVYRYTLPELFSNRQSFVFKGGAFIAHTGKSELYADKDLVANQVFERFDAGVTAAVGSQHAFGSFVFEYGLQSDIGFNNIATNSTQSAKKFNYTNTYLTGVYFSFRYRF